MGQEKAAAAVGVAGLGLALMMVKDFQIWHKILPVYASTKPVNGLGHQAQQGSSSSQGELDSTCASYLYGSVHSATLSSCSGAASGFGPA